MISNSFDFDFSLFHDYGNKSNSNARMVRLTNLWLSDQ